MRNRLREREISNAYKTKMKVPLLFSLSPGVVYTVAIINVIRYTVGDLTLLCWGAMVEKRIPSFSFYVFASLFSLFLSSLSLYFFFVPVYSSFFLLPFLVSVSASPFHLVFHTHTLIYIRMSLYIHSYICLSSSVSPSISFYSFFYVCDRPTLSLSPFMLASLCPAAALSSPLRSCLHVSTNQYL